MAKVESRIAGINGILQFFVMIDKSTPNAPHSSIKNGLCISVIRNELAKTAK